MSDFMRFLLTDATELNLSTLEAALQGVDARFTIHRDQAEPRSGDLMFASEAYAEIDINHPGDQVFDEDIEELRDILAQIDEPNKDAVLRVLERTQAMVVLKVLFMGNLDYDRIDPLWDWLFEHHAGLLQVDEEGYYDDFGLVLPTTPDDAP